ncbi:MAG: phage head closure protein [Beijerinckiaceae bacterium]|nr:phage head closure protein [Beijerinckiaceae bacterium]
MSIEAGKLDRRIVIQRATVTTNALNEEVQSWAPLITVWAGKREVSDRERFAANEIGAEVTTRFTIRWSTQAGAVDARDRILYDGRVYNIHHAKEIGRRDGIEITAAARSEEPAP